MSLVLDRWGRAAGGKPSLPRALRRLHGDEQGDEGVNKILIIAMIVVPLVIVLILFGKEIVTFFSDSWANLTDTHRTSSPDEGFQPIAVDGSTGGGARGGFGIEVDVGVRSGR